MSTEVDFEGERLQASLRARMFGESLPRPCIGKYRLDAPIGEGSMGTVYRAIDEELERAVALKLLRPDVAGEVAIQRLVREAKALARLNHPNVVTIHEAGRHGDRSFIAMELVDGHSLQRWNDAHPERTPERFARALALMLDAADALETAHRAGIVHRDLKPANILIGADGRLRLADFGLALADGAPTLGQTETAADDPPWGEVGSLTATGRFVGTPAYMAPEQFDGQTSPQSDQFSFCAAFFESFYGVRPYAGSTLEQLRFAIAQHDLALAPSASAVPHWMYELLARGLHPEPGARFPSIAALVDAVHRAERRSRRTRVGVMALGIGSMGLLSWVMWPTPPEETSACDDARTILTDAWGPSRRTAVRDAFVATQLPFAASVFDEVDATLSKHADAWLAERLEACLDVDTSPSAAALARMECLDEGLVELEGKVSVLQGVSATSLVEAPAVVLALAAPSECTTRIAPRPSDRSEDARRLVRAIARGEALFALGDPDAAEVLTAAATEADAASLPALEARACRDVATALVQRDDLHGSLKWAERALEASERADDLRGQFDAWIRLAQTQDTLGMESESFSLRRAASILERIEDPSWRAAQLPWTEANVNFGDADAAGKVETLERAKVAIEPYRDAYPLTYAGITTDLGSALLRIGEIRDGLQSLENGVVAFEAVYGRESPQLAGPLVGLAQAQMQDDALEVGYELATRASNLLVTVPNSQPEARTGAAYIRATALTLLGRPAEAIPILEEMLDATSAAGHEKARYNIRVARLQLGSAYGKLGKWKEAVALYDALIAEESVEDSRDFAAGSTRMNLANACAQLGLTDRTAQAIREGRSIIEALAPVGSRPHTDMLRVVAYAWVDIGRPEDGLRVADQALATDDLSDKMAGELLFARARALQDLGRDDEATKAGAEARTHLVAAGDEAAPILEELEAWEASRSG